MLRWFFFIILAVWVTRLFQARRPAPREPRVSDFHPAAGAGDPSPAPGPEDGAAFSSGEIVEGEFEEIKDPPRP
jgi:hypothetical protein